MMLRTLDEEEAGGGNETLTEESPSPPKTHRHRRRTVGKTVAAARRNSALCLALCASAASLVWIITREDGAVLSGSEPLSPWAEHHFGKPNKNARGVGLDERIDSFGRQEQPPPRTRADEGLASEHARAAREPTGASELAAIHGRPAIDPIPGALDIADTLTSFAENLTENHAHTGGRGGLQAGQARPTERPGGWGGAAGPVGIREAGAVRGAWVEDEVDRAARFGLGAESVAPPRVTTHPGNTADDMERVKGDALLVGGADVEEDWGKLLENMAEDEWDFEVVDSSRKKKPIDGGMHAAVGEGWPRWEDASERSRYAEGGAPPEAKPALITPRNADRDRFVNGGSAEPPPSSGKKAVGAKIPPMLSPAGRAEGTKEVESGTVGVAAKENHVRKAGGVPSGALEGEERERQEGDKRDAETEGEAKRPVLNDAATATVAPAPNREAQEGDARGRRQPEGGDAILTDKNPALIEAAVELLAMMTAAKEKKEHAEPVETEGSTEPKIPAQADKEKHMPYLKNEATTAPSARDAEGAAGIEGEGELRQPESNEKASKVRQEGVLIADKLDQAVEERAQGVQRGAILLPPLPADEGIVAPGGVGERSGKGGSDSRGAEDRDRDARPAEEIQTRQENEQPAKGKKHDADAGDKKSAPERGSTTSTPPKRESPDVDDVKRSDVKPPARHADRWEQAHRNHDGDKPSTAELVAQPVPAPGGPHHGGEGAARPGEKVAGGGKEGGEGGGGGAVIPCRLEGRVEHWEPPATADLRSSYRWKDAQKASIDRIRRFNLGGIALRDLIHQEVVGLDILRHDLFC